jgi:hypothetical protein
MSVRTFNASYSQLHGFLEAMDLHLASAHSRTLAKWTLAAVSETLGRPMDATPKQYICISGSIRGRVAWTQLPSSHSKLLREGGAHVVTINGKRPIVSETAVMYCFGSIHRQSIGRPR